MQSQDKHPHHQPSNDPARGGRATPGSRFRYIPQPDDPDAHGRSTLPGIFRITFPVCDARSFGDKYRLFVKMVITGPLESEAPRDIVNELDIIDTFESVRAEFAALQIAPDGCEDLGDASAALLQTVHYMHQYYYLDANLQRVLEKERITAKEAEARLHGRSPWSRRLRMRPAHKSKGEKHRNLREQSRALQQESRRPVTALATIIRCDALPLEDAVGHEVAWEAYIDDYVGAPLIHRWRQRVDSVQAYEELRRDLEVLCVDLNSYTDIEKACRAARGQRISSDLPLIDIGDGKACLLAHFTKKEHQLPPIHERMTRAEAHDYCRQHGLAAFAGDLETMHFIDEVQFKSKSRALQATAEVVPAAAAQPSLASVPLDEAGQPMKPLFGHILDSYKLVQSPVEPHASNPIAPEGTFCLKATHCTVRKTGSHYHAQIRLVLYNHDLDPPFEAVYEQDRELTYKQL